MHKITFNIKRSNCILFFVLLIITGLKANVVKYHFGGVQTTITGRIVSEGDGTPLPGVNVLEKGTQNGVVTDFDGNYKITVTTADAVLVFSYLGFVAQEISVKNAEDDQIDVALQASTETLDELVIVGFGTQKKESLVSSVSTIDVENLKRPSSNLTHAIAGQVAGVISFQQSGEPGLGTDDSKFFIRGLSTFGTGKTNPLILIDGIESSTTDMARLQPDDISNFSVLKDAAASSIYGARGANGVILIKTKMGKEGETKFGIRVENRVSTNTKNFQLADNIAYMRLENQATVSRTQDFIPPYSENKIRNTIAGADPYLYPNNDWMGKLIKDYTYNQAVNLNISGGTSKGRYYLAGTYNRDNGILQVDPINDFNNNIVLNNYSLRTNLELDLTKTTLFTARIYAQFDDYTGPIGGGEATFNNVLWSNPVMFPAVYPKEKNPYVSHPLFGSALVRNTGDLSAGSILLINPYAEMVKGYQTYKRSNISPQLELKQDFDFLTKGLSARAMAYVKRISFVKQNRFYNPFFYSPTIDPTDGSYTINVLNDGGQNSVGTPGTEYLNYNEDEKKVESQLWLEGAVNYNRTFGKHAVGGMLVSYISQIEAGNPGSLIQSLPNRNQGLSGRFTYDYDSRYLLELNFGYNGSERFARKNRFGFFPSAGVAYRISNEQFFKPLTDVISNFKLRATYGVVGNDKVGSDSQRFLYLSNVNLNDGGYGASFGKNDGAPVYYRPGVSISRYENNDISWEESRQLNLGFDLELWNSLEIVADVFEQHRSNILQPITYIDNASGLNAVPFASYGKAKSRGAEFSLDYNKSFSEDLSIIARGTFTYATSKAIDINELDYEEDLSHLRQAGRSLSQEWGYIAERLFTDDEEVANSPVQFNDETLLAGDIKYHDVTGDGVIDADDRVPLGFPGQPEIIYGFGASVFYKDFDFNFYFQGSARSSFFINPAAIQPFFKNGGYQNGLLQVIADDHWSETNRDSYAFWPRMGTERVPSNDVPSTWWLRNGDFLRLKTVDLGYNINGLETIGIDNTRIYLSAVNLFAISSFKLWDVEMGGRGLGYPIQSVYNLGISVNF